MNIPNQSRSFHSPGTFIALVMILLFLSSCNMPIAPNSPGAASPTSTLMVSQGTPAETTATYTATISPTATMTVTPPGMTIAFSPGATAAVKQGSLSPGQEHSYTLAAAKNQAMILSVDSPLRDVTLAVYEEDGSILLNPSYGWINFQWILPATQIYTIKVIGGSASENYTLTVKVAAQVSVPAGGGPKTFSGSTINGYVFSYAVNCQSNKTLHLTLNVPASSAYLDVIGIATGILLDPALHLTSWSGVLPSTQNYIIEIIPVAGQVVDFSLTISVD